MLGNLELTEVGALFRTVIYYAEQDTKIAPTTGGPNIALHCAVLLGTM